MKSESGDCSAGRAPENHVPFAGEKLRTCAVCLSLIVGTSVLYAPVLGFKFISFDDVTYVTTNYHIREFSWRAIAWSFQPGYASNWHPLTWMSHMLDYQLYGLNAGGHHVTNVVLHAFTSMLLFLVLLRMTGAFWRCAVVAALFAWHPMHVESVAWVSERKDVLSALFWMLTMWSWLRYVQPGNPQNARGRFFYALALAFYALGSMAKPMLVSLPFVLLLLDWWPLDRVRQTRTNLNSVARPALVVVILEKVPLFLMSALSCVLTLYAQDRGGAVRSLASEPIELRISNALVGYVHYLSSLFWPKNLTVIYAFEKNLPPWTTAAALLLLVAISCFAMQLWKTRPYFLVGWLWFLGTLVPVIGLVQVGSQAFADRYAYLPSIGLFVMVCWSLNDLSVLGRLKPIVAGVLAWAVVGTCVVLTSRQLLYWQNSGTLFRHAIAVTPDNPIAHANYAAYLCDAQQYDQAAAECKMALAVSPDDQGVHFILGKVLFLDGKLDQAAPELNTALRLNPNRYAARVMLARIALAQGSPLDAAGQVSMLLAAEPNYPEARCVLGQALMGQGNLDLACAQFTEALRLSPGYAEAHHQFAVALALEHQTAPAIAHYHAALALEPNRIDSLNNLAWLLATDPRPENRNGAEAVQLATKACDLTRRQQPFLLGTLGAAYAEAGRYDEAISTAQQAHDLAVAGGLKDVAAKNEELLGLYRKHQAYRDK